MKSERPKIRVGEKKWKQPQITHNQLTKWNWVVNNPQNLQLGRNVDIGAFTYIQAENGVIIHDNVQIGSHVAIYSANTIDGIDGSVEIMEGACIGSHAVILPNVRIGKNAKVRCHSTITRDVEDETTV